MSASYASGTRGGQSRGTVARRHCTPPRGRREFAAMPSASAPVAIAQTQGEAGAFDVITVDNLSRRFGDLWALRGASFSIRR
ncbi:MAG TPA: hypothetical protein VJS69_14985, partial [Candidatus Krumholzibacteria bacterium]|nr:hypothetical protein [Candidatus Krumholzibacteria bacterium]